MYCYYYCILLNIVSGELGVWTDWSEWSGCEDPGDYVATRTRKCLTRDTREPTSVDRCLLIPGNKSDLDLMPCRIYLSQNSDLDEYFTVPPALPTSTNKEVIEQAPNNKVIENGKYKFFDNIIYVMLYMYCIIRRNSAVL